MRAVLAVIIGVISAFAVQAAVDMIASNFYPYAITDMWDRRQYMEAIAARPTGALLLMVLGYFLGGLIGGAFAKGIGRRRGLVWVPAAVLSLTSILLIFAYPFPAWSWIALFAAPLIGGLFANHVIGEGPDEAEDRPAAEMPSDASL